MKEKFFWLIFIVAGYNQVCIAQSSLFNNEEVDLWKSNPQVNEKEKINPQQNYFIQDQDAPKPVIVQDLPESLPDVKVEYSPIEPVAEPDDEPKLDLLTEDTKPETEDDPQNTIRLVKYVPTSSQVYMHYLINMSYSAGLGLIFANLIVFSNNLNTRGNFQVFGTSMVISLLLGGIISALTTDSIPPLPGYQLYTPQIQSKAGLNVPNSTFEYQEDLFHSRLLNKDLDNKQNLRIGLVSLKF